MQTKGRAQAAIMHLGTKCRTGLSLGKTRFLQALLLAVLSKVLVMTTPPKCHHSSRSIKTRQAPNIAGLKERRRAVIQEKTVWG